MKMERRLSSLTVAFNITKCVFILYAVYYCVGSVVYGIYSLENFDGTIPFNFKTWIDLRKCCDYTNTEMVNLVSMLIAFPVSGIICGFFVNTWLWDYAVTVTLIHILLSCLVMLALPSSWSWFVCLGACLLMMIGLGEGVCALRRYRDKSRFIAPEPTPRKPGTHERQYRLPCALLDNIIMRRTMRKGTFVLSF